MVLLMTTNAYFSAIFEPPGFFPGQKIIVTKTYTVKQSKTNNTQQISNDVSANFDRNGKPRE